MAAAMIRRAQLMGMAGEGAPGHRNYSAWKIGTHNLSQMWIVAGLAMSGYSFGIWAGTVLTKFEKQTLGAAEERRELREKLGHKE
uniref:Uncharacterized protein n=1 Tax=Oryza meridionalis TaxID=40149 RepID=A0A0E0D391_9ORYZ